MCPFNGSRPAIAMALLLAVGLLAGCSGAEDTRSASAELRVLLSQELSGAGVARVRVEVSGPGISPNIATELAQSGNAWQGSLSSIPAGQGRLFRASAYDAASTLLYTGEAGPLTIEQGQTVNVAILLQQASPETPFENEAPQIGSVVLSSNPVAPGGSVTVTAYATDANAGDTLSYAWTASAGAFSAPTSPVSTWTAPSTEGTQQLKLVVTDSKGASAALSLDVSVVRPGAGGGATVSTGFNSWPSIRAMNGTPSLLTPGSLTRLSATVTDADGDAPSYQWSSNCEGSFDDATAASPTFFLGTAPVGGRCALHLSVQDGRGGRHAGTLLLHVSALVTGKRDRLHVHENGSATPVPEDLSTQTLGAWLPTSDGTGYTWSTGRGLSNGTFSIPDVTGTSYLLRLGNEYLWTSQRGLDLSRNILGRPDVELEPEPIPLELQLSGLSPWSMLDDLQWHSPTAGLGFVALQGCSFDGFGFPADGATTFSGIADYGSFLGACGNPTARFDPARDSLYVTQLAGRTDPVTDIYYQEARRVLTTSGPERTPSGSLRVQGSLTTLPLTSRQMTVQASAFESLARAAHPNAVLSGNFASLGTQVGYSQFGTVNNGWPDLATASIESEVGDFTASFQYGNPYPGEWNSFSYVLVGARVPYTLARPDGGTSTHWISASLIAREPLSGTEPVTVVPRIGPPQGLSLNGLSATENRTNVGLLPLVSWTPHTLGTPSHYNLRLYRLYLSGNTVLRQYVASLYTPLTQLRLPPGLLIPGERYFLQVAAYYEPNGNPNNPFRDSSISHMASTFTGTFTP
ncbi:PKD domain-containing protein [Melittangium boletus]|uniref:Uncharacterized protein n=1 Tax=Melittangium boletus DSM 14713 TaxID=1294270 RepID=A0A250IHB8_9BACT|nr:PKD domain-containing protein [Melittangium boletus]ATB31214.1 hypothetical protein MEBOL_004676 [Melittangium boletus DSM 14713]